MVGYRAVSQKDRRRSRRAGHGSAGAASHSPILWYSSAWPRETVKNHLQSIYVKTPNLKPHCHTLFDRESAGDQTEGYLPYSPSVASALAQCDRSTRDTIDRCIQPVKAHNASCAYW
jgi:hypothetical protein